MPPNNYRSISEEELRRKYIDEGWREKLDQLYQRVPWPFSASHPLLIWKDGDRIMAIVHEYEDGTLVVRKLVDDDIEYVIP